MKLATPPPPPPPNAQWAGLPRGLVLLVAVAILVDNNLSLAQAQHKSKCSAEREREMDLCSAKMGFLGDHSFVVPKNLSAANEFCLTLKNSINCLQSYSRDCLQGFTKQLLSSLLKRGKQQYQSICQTDTTKLDLSSKLACLTGDKIGNLHLCLDSSIARYEFIREKVRPEFKLPSLCCSYCLFNLDLAETLTRICDKQPGSRSSLAGNANHQQQQASNRTTESPEFEFIHKIASSTAGEFFHLICDNHQTIAECKQSDKTTDTLKKLEQIGKQVKAGKLKPQSKSLIPVLLDILDTSEPI